MKNTRWILAFLGAALLSIAACDMEMTVIDGAGEMGSTEFSIHNGSGPDAAHHDAVVALHELTPDGNSVYVSPFCSGTLVSGDVIVTAAHCLDTAKGGPKFKTMDPATLAIYVGDDPSLDIIDHLYLVTETEIHPDFNRNQLVNDIALVRLATAVTEPVTPVPNLSAADEFTNGDIGTDLNFAGFGQDENGASGVKLQGDWPLGGLGCSVAGCPGGGDADTQISYVQGNGGPCFGDSGGPAFIERNAAWYLGGITSYGDSYCTIYGVSTRVDAYETYIDDFVNGAVPPPAPDCSNDGWCNPDCDAGDDADCAAPPPENCGDGVCGAGESCDGRDATASCPADCDGVTNGKPSNRYCYVEGFCEGGGCP